MKNNPKILNSKAQIEVPDWLFQETQEDDFLMGKTPQDLGDTWEEE